jgi:hypothetical protein
MKVQFATTSYQSQSLPISAQRAVNCYAEAQPKDAKTDVAVFGCPGLETFATCGAGPVRGMHVMGGLLYVVSGQRLYTVTSAGAVTDIGGNITGSDVVSMDNNGDQLVIVNGVNGYLYSEDLGFILISDTDFNAAETVTFFDQRFLFDWKGTNKFFASDVLDGSTYDALAFASGETRPDNVVSVILNRQLLLVFGSDSIEPWQNVGAANFPFERVPGAMIERGIAEPHARCKADNTVFFMGDDRVFYRLDGLTPIRVSTHALEQAWQSYTSMQGAFCFSYSWNGHKFVVVNITSANVTFELDVSTGLWHERESWDVHGHSLGRWRGNCHADVYDRVMIGDAFSGRVGYLSASIYDEFDCTMQLRAVSPPIHSDRKRVFIPRFEMDIEGGVGLSTGQGSLPQAMLRYSKDGGRSWSDRQLWQSMGGIGDYATRMRWLRLGQAREWVFEITISDPVKRTIISAHADLMQGTG